MKKDDEKSKPFLISFQSFVGTNVLLSSVMSDSGAINVTNVDKSIKIDTSRILISLLL